MVRNSCLICGDEEIQTVIDLGMHPFADTFVPMDRFSEPDNAYPLVCDLCEKCGQLQTRFVTNPQDRYCKVNYSYTSSNSGVARAHWDRYASQIADCVTLAKDSFVVEIGSNDGYLSEQFRLRGCRVLGVDPSSYMADLARARGVETVVSLFSRETAAEIRRKHGPARLIVANNVFNHSDDPASFTAGVKELLDADGTFVFELPYWYEGFRTGKFDQIYHEHVSYFTARSAQSLLERAGMCVVGIEVVDYHGGSLRVMAKLKHERALKCDELTRLIELETAAGIFAASSYPTFVDRITDQRNRLLHHLLEEKLRGTPIVAVGAAAKGNTFLNFYRLDHSIIDFVTDSSPHKQGKLTPLSRIPIRGDDVFKEYGPVCALILSWNIGAHLREILLKINPRISFIEMANYEKKEYLDRGGAPAGVA